MRNSMSFFGIVVIAGEVAVGAISGTPAAMVTLPAAGITVPLSRGPTMSGILDGDELARGIDRALFGALRVDDDEAQLLAPEDAAVGIDLVDRELLGGEQRRHEVCDRSGNVHERAELHLVLRSRVGDQRHR